MKNKIAFLITFLLLTINLLAQNPNEIKIKVQYEDVTPRKPLDYTTNFDWLSKTANERGKLDEQAYTTVRLIYNKIAEIIDYEEYDSQLLMELTLLKNRLKSLMNPQVDLVSHIPEINQCTEDFQSYMRRYEVRKRKIAEAKVLSESTNQNSQKSSNAITEDMMDIIIDGKKYHYNESTSQYVATGQNSQNSSNSIRDIPSSTTNTANEKVTNNSVINASINDFTESSTGIVFQMKYIESNSFQMGRDGYESEKPVHTVQLSKFFISKYEVTNDEFCIFLNEKGNRTEEGATWLQLGSDDDYDIVKSKNRFTIKNGRGRHPIRGVNWYGATAYCVWLTQKTGKNYRLPTEAEWEYASRGGQTYNYAGSDNPLDIAWCHSNSGGKVHDVGMKQPNGFGLYDMSGNVEEWCSDWYDENYYKNSLTQNPQGANFGKGRVLRGGSYGDGVDYTCFCSFRYGREPTAGGLVFGFRVVRD